MLSCRVVFRGFMVATTSTQYIYIVENSTVLMNYHKSTKKGGEGGEGVNSDGSAMPAADTSTSTSHITSSNIKYISSNNSGASANTSASVSVSAAVSTTSGSGSGSGAVYYKHTHVATSAVSMRIIE
jgi:hypothetical protein